MQTLKIKRTGFFLAVALLTQTALGCILFPQAVFAASFQDVTESHAYFTAIEALKKANVINGYEDGTFQPERKINRAESLKILLSSVQKKPGEGLFDSGFSDVPINAWYAGYVMTGVQEGFINGNPNGSFTPEKNVNRAEFIKMVLGAFKTDISRHKNITQSIAPDVVAKSWFLPYMSYAKTVGLVYPDLTGALHPSKEMTRGECVFMLYKMLLMHQGGEAQKNLSMAEAQLVSAQISLTQGDTESAKNAVNAAADMSKKSYQMFPQSMAAKATFLMSQAFQKLVEGYQKAAEIQQVLPDGAVPDPMQTAVLIEAMKQSLAQARQLADEAVLASASVESFHTSLTTYANLLTTTEE